jgi:hypothetical protein
MEKKRNSHGLSLSLLFVALVSCSAGCIAIPYHPRGITGSGGSGKTSQFKVLKGNAVTKDVVDKELSFIETGVRAPQLIWGRFSRKWVWCFFGPGILGCEDKWGSYNLIAEFEQDHRLKQWKIVDDGDFLKTISPILRQNNVVQAATMTVRAPCSLPWNDLTRVKAQSFLQGELSHRQIQLVFYKDKKVVCSATMTPVEAFEVIRYLISTGRESLFYKR